MDNRQCENRARTVRLSKLNEGTESKDKEKSKGTRRVGCTRGIRGDGMDAQGDICMGSGHTVGRAALLSEMEEMVSAEGGCAGSEPLGARNERLVCRKP